MGYNANMVLIYEIFKKQITKKFKIFHMKQGTKPVFTTSFLFLMEKKKIKKLLWTSAVQRYLSLQTAVQEYGRTETPYASGPGVCDSIPLPQGSHWISD